MTRSPASAHKLYFLTQRVAHVLKTCADAELAAAANLTTAQAATLAVIAERAPVAQNEVARELQQNESAITAMVRRLEKLGYVTRSRSQEDGRAWALSVSSKGHAALDATRPAFGKINDLIDRHVGAGQAAALARSLAALLEDADRT